MPVLSELVADFTALEVPMGIVLEDGVVTAQAIAATRFYAGYGDIASWPVGEPAPDITPATILSLSEWAVIRRLFKLYVEKENAVMLETTKMTGMEQWGRTSGEVAGDIAQLEMEIPRLAFGYGVSRV